MPFSYDRALEIIFKGFCPSINDYVWAEQACAGHEQTIYEVAEGNYTNVRPPGTPQDCAAVLDKVIRKWVTPTTAELGNLIEHLNHILCAFYREGKTHLREYITRVDRDREESFYGNTGAFGDSMPQKNMLRNIHTALGTCSVLNMTDQNEFKTFMDYRKRFTQDFLPQFLRNTRYNDGIYAAVMVNENGIIPVLFHQVRAAANMVLKRPYDRTKVVKYVLTYVRSRTDTENTGWNLSFPYFLTIADPPRQKPPTVSLGRASGKEFWAKFEKQNLKEPVDRAQVQTMFALSGYSFQNMLGRVIKANKGIAADGKKRDPVFDTLMKQNTKLFYQDKFDTDVRYSEIEAQNFEYILRTMEGNAPRPAIPAVRRPARVVTPAKKEEETSSMATMVVVAVAVLALFAVTR